MARTRPLEVRLSEQGQHPATIDRAQDPALPPLEVVVVSYRSEALISRCLTSVRQHTPVGTLVYVVDNASPDNTAAVVRRDFPEVLLMERSGNDGFAVANNAALRRVVAPYVLVLNPDAELAAGVIEHLIGVMDKHGDIGMIGCRLLTADGTPDHAAKRFIPTPAEATQYFVGRLFGKRISRYTAPDIDEFGLGDVDAINGAFMLVRKSAMDIVGLFDEGYWMYAEDLDWCTRFRVAGWRVVYDGRVTAFHIKGGVAGIRSPRLNYEFHRSMARYYRAYNGPVAIAAFPVVTGIWLKFALTTIVDLVRRAAKAELPRM